MDEDSSDDGDLFNEWKNKIIRNSLAKSSLIKIKQTKTNSFFTKGKVLIKLNKFLNNNNKLYSIAEYVKETQTDALFINTELSPKQVKTLEKTLTNVYNDRPFISKPNTQDSDLDSSGSDIDYANRPEKTIRVFDRFSIILQIFAKRAKTKLARLQIELRF